MLSLRTIIHEPYWLFHRKIIVHKFFTKQEIVESRNTSTSKPIIIDSTLKVPGESMYKLLNPAFLEWKVVSRLTSIPTK